MKLACPFCLALLFLTIFAPRDAAAAELDTPWSWNTLEADLRNAAEHGFEGAVLIVRGGNVVLLEGFGWANRELEIPNRPETVFAIGSAPIDFTKAGILLLRDRGQLKLDDPITTFFSPVPPDKQEVTLRHLMTGESGFPDFHDLPGDGNPDHTWIDRKEAVRRMMNHTLLFPPGEGSEHSHSAWGLLAAVIEVVSGQTYPEFTEKELFEPLGMHDTGFFGEPVSEDRIAVGYGRRSSTPNSPPHWGPTSWLVMGSGGQVSTVEDLYRWKRGIRQGGLLSEESRRWFSGDDLNRDGDEFGFELMHNNDPENCFIVISNAIASREDLETFGAIGDELARLVYNEASYARAAANPRKFTLGVAMNILDTGVEVADVVSGGAAEKAGLRPGDVLLSAGGRALGEDPMAVLDPYLESGEEIPFEVSRDGGRMTIRVTPHPR